MIFLFDNNRVSTLKNNSIKMKISSGFQHGFNHQNVHNYLQIKGLTN